MHNWPLRKYNLPASQTQKNLEQESRGLTLLPLQHLASCGTKHMGIRLTGDPGTGRGIWFSEVECWDWDFWYILHLQMITSHEGTRSKYVCCWMRRMIDSWSALISLSSHGVTYDYRTNSTCRFGLWLYSSVLTQKQWVDSIIFKIWAWVSDVLRLLTKASKNVLRISYP